jgi:hypothetical protein
MRHMKKVLKIARCYIIIYRKTLQKLVRRKSRLSLWMRFEEENSQCLLMSLEMYQLSCKWR